MWMTRSPLPCLVVLLALTTATATAQNLVTNGSFDHDVGGWRTDGPEVQALFRGADGSTLPGGSGPGCLEVDLYSYLGGSSGPWQAVAVEGGHAYRMAASYYYPAHGDNVADKVVLIMFWRDADGGDLDWAYTEAGPLLADTWSRLTLDASAPADAASAIVVLGVGNPNLADETRPGIAYFDDVVVARRDDAVAVDVLFLPAAAATPGLGGTYWSTVLWAASLVDTPVTLRGAMLHPDVDSSSAFDATRVLGTIPPAGHLEIADVVAALGESGAGGLIVIAEAETAGPPLVQVGSRTSTANQNGPGSYGQGIGAVRGSEAGVQVAPGAVVDATFRTNAGALNLSATTLQLMVTVVDAAGATVATTTWTLPPFAHHQVSLRSLGLDRLDGGSVHFSRLGNDVPYVAYLSIVDQATGDPTYVAAR